MEIPQHLIDMSIHTPDLWAKAVKVTRNVALLTKINDNPTKFTSQCDELLRVVRADNQVTLNVGEVAKILDGFEIIGIYSDKILAKPVSLIGERVFVINIGPVDNSGSLMEILIGRGDFHLALEHIHSHQRSTNQTPAIVAINILSHRAEELEKYAHSLMSSGIAYPRYVVANMFINVLERKMLAFVQAETANVK